MSKKLHVAVLYGGLSAEREVSLVSGKAVEKALKELGYEVSMVDAKQNTAAQLASLQPDVVFNALHGRFGEDGCVQGLLEYMGIPYTHSGVMASAIAMDKPMAKQIFRQVGIATPEGKVMTAKELLKGDPMPRPYVIKPVNEGSSVGVTILMENENMQPNIAHDAATSPESLFLIEPYIAGREIQVAVLGDKALGAIEIRAKNKFYDYEAKYTDGKAEHLMPAPISKEKYDEVMQLALKAHQALGCKGLTRSDFRMEASSEQGEGKFYLLEVNTQPGMTPLSLSPEIAAHAGISFNQLVNMLIVEALSEERKGQSREQVDGTQTNRAAAPV